MVMPVTADVNELVRSAHAHWMDRPPQRCARGHWLLPGHMIVDTVECSCGRHVCWECECGSVTYGPELTKLCGLGSHSADAELSS